MEIEGGVTTEVTNQEYLNVLNTTVEGVYTCHVTVVEYVVFSNVTTERSFTDQRTINITSGFRVNCHILLCVCVSL